MDTGLLTPDFRALSVRLGQDPRQVQGAGGNTSIKAGGVMWIKASGTELADAKRKDIFVAVDRNAAKAEITGSGDGSCKDTVLDPASGLRPSIETTFHAALEWAVVAHTHSVATLTHVISPQGRAAAMAKLESLDPVLVPYAKPGLQLTREILARARSETRVILLENHGLIVAGEDVSTVSDHMADVERRLALPARDTALPVFDTPPPSGFDWHASSWMARAPRIAGYVAAHSLYPDHVVFLGPGLNPDQAPDRPVRFAAGHGIALQSDATPSQKAMLTCLGDIMARLPEGWEPAPIGPDAEAALLNWDAEKYRQALAARS
ncbi:MAG: class II aldolase/adducin family protein [Litoreibacter sp.]|nr:class II aldolase/adducin family protein [Litoreibacter sp.]